MRRVLTCLGMISVLLLTGFMSKVYAAGDFPTSDTLGTQIREWINNQLREVFPPGSGEFSVVKIRLNGFPHQTSESVTNVALSGKFPCLEFGKCQGVSNIVIPGIGQGHVLVHVISFVVPFLDHDIATAGITTVSIDSLPGQTAAAPIIIYFNGASQADVSRTINIPGIGTGQATVQIR